MIIPSIEIFFISIETDSLTKEALEIETLEIMSNGLPKFGVYSLDGQLKEGGSPSITRAGKPAKCLWCHETSILPLFRKQQDWEGFFTFAELDTFLKKKNQMLRTFQWNNWKDPHFREKATHEKMEISYISFMEPSAERLAHEWQMPLEEVKLKLEGLETHRHHEFDFLGDLYHRKDVDPLGPWQVVAAPESIREEQLMHD